jgi:hypothetical protein
MDMPRIVGAADSWDIVIDSSEPPKPPGAPPFPNSWIKFSSTTAPHIARQYNRAPAVLDLSETPVLLFNEDIDGLQELLHAARPQLERRRQQDVLGSSIARSALAAVFRAAVAEMDLDEELQVVEPPSDRLQREVCEAVAGAMPSVATAGELYERLQSALGASDRAVLWAEIDLALDRLTGLPEAISRVTWELKHG